MATKVWRIGQLARRAGVTPDALRYYERLGLLAPARRTNGNYRLYDRAALERVAFIRKSQVLGLTLEETREILHVAASGTAPCAHVRATLRRRLTDIDVLLAELASLRTALKRALAQSRTGPVARPCLCQIIESVEVPRRRAHGPRR